MWALLLACAGPRSGSAVEDCAPTALGPGELRVCRLGVGDDSQGVGERPLDWRLQNAVLDVIVRGADAALTRLRGAGGSVVAAIPAGGEDPVLELLPELEAGWLLSLEIEPLEEEGRVGLLLRGLDEEGGTRELSWSLGADAPLLRLQGADSLLALGPAGAARLGASLEVGETLIAADLEAEDLGGALRLVVPAEGGVAELAIADRRAAYEALWPDGLAVSGTAVGAAFVEARRGGAARARLPVEADGRFSGEVPWDSDALVATAPGFGDGPEVAPGEGLRLPLGAEGGLWVRAVDERGADLAALLRVEGEDQLVLPGGSFLPLPPGEHTVSLWAGPGREALLDVSVVAEPGARLQASLPAVGPTGEDLLVELFERGWPDQGVREPAADRLSRARARGVGFAVLSAEDELAQGLADPERLSALPVEAGSLTMSPELGPLLSWPWSPDGDRAAQGAAPWHLLDPEALLLTVHRGGGRTVLLPVEGLAALPGVGLDEAITAIVLDAEGDPEPWLQALAAGRALPVVGPWTWLEGLRLDRYGEVDVEAALLRGRSVASTGPRLRLRVEGSGPGALVEGSGEALLAEIEVWTPAWAPADTLTLRDARGERLRLPLDRGPRALRVTIPVEAEGFLVARVEGDTPSPLTGARPFAQTSPIWIVKPISP